MTLSHVNTSSTDRKWTLLSYRGIKKKINRSEKNLDKLIKIHHSTGCVLFLLYRIDQTIKISIVLVVVGPLSSLPKTVYILLSAKCIPQFSAIFIIS